MIKRITIILIILFLFMQPLTVYADVIMGNDFFFKHRDETEPLHRSFYVDSPDGFISVKEEPGARREILSFENGTIIRIAATYKHRGRYWGIPPMGHAYYFSGWFPMEELLMYYESNDFEAEHVDEFYDYTGDFYNISSAEEFYFWQWPGSDREKILYEVSEYYELDESNAIRAKYAYMDDEGREWVYVFIFDGYTAGLSRAGSADGWVCISDVSNNRIPAFFPAPEPRKWSPDDPYNWTGSTTPDDPPDDPPANNTKNPTGIEDPPRPDENQNEIPVILIIIVLGLTLVVSTTVLVLVLVKQKKGKS